MIELIKVNKTFGKKKVKKEVLKDINISFPQIGYVNIIGKSGGGKTTLLNIIAGYETVTSGEVRVCGKDLAKMKPNEFQAYQDNIGVLLQDSIMFENKTVCENIVFPLSRSGEEVDVNYLEELMERFKVSKLKGRYPDELSKGEKQRICMCRTLIHKPKIILVDEPTSALDKDNAETLFSVLKEQSKSALVIVVTHDISCTNSEIGRKIRLEDGQIMEDNHLINEEDQEEPRIQFNRKPTKKEVLKEIVFENNKCVFKRLKGGFFVLLAVFSVFAFCVNLLYFSEAKRFKQIYERNNIEYVFIEKLGIQEGEIDELRLKTLPHKTYFLDSYDETESLNYYLGKNLLFSTEFKYGVELTSQFFIDTGLSLSTGRKPEKDDEIVLPKYILDELKNDSTYTGVISGFKVVGSIDTRIGVTYDRVDRCIFFKEGYFSSLNGLYKNNIFRINHQYSSYRKVASFDYLKQNEKTVMLNENITSLSDNQAVISADQYLYMNSGEIDYDERRAIKEQLISEFAEENFEVVRDKFNSPSDYKEYIRSNGSNEYQPKFNSGYFEKQAEYQLALNLLKDKNLITMKWQILDKNSNYIDLEYEIVGLYVQEASRDFHDTLVVSESEYQKLSLMNPQIAGFFVNINGISNRLYKEITNVNSMYYASSSISWKMSLGDSIFIYIRYASFPFALILLVLSGFILSTYMKLSILERKKEIGLYRLNQVSKNELRNTFFLSYGLFCLVCSIIAIGISTLLMVFMNSLFISMEYEQVMCFSGLGVFIVLVSVLAMCFVVNFIYTKKHLDKNVVKLLKESDS